MKRLLPLLLLLSLLVTSLSCIPAFAADGGYELLEDGSFDQAPGFTWIAYVASTVQVSENGQNGTCLSVTRRTHHTDVVRQYITKKLSFYGHGTYEISASVRLADADAQPVDAQIAIGMYSANGAKKWATSDFITVTADGWTQITAQVSLSWEDTLEQAEFYLITREGQEGTDFRDLLIDDCGMKTVSYEGEEYATEPVTEKPTEPVTEPVTEPPTSEPTETPTEPEQEPVTDEPTVSDEATHEATDEVTDEPATEEDSAPAEETVPADGASKQSKVIGGMLIAIGVILLACGAALIVTYVKGGKQS